MQSYRESKRLITKKADCYEPIMTPKNKTKIAYIIDQLGTGGTERQLKILIDNLDPSIFDISLFLLRGDKEHYLKPKNISTYLLDINKLASLDCFFKLLKLSRTLKKEKYQIIQTFFQDSTIIGALAGKIVGINEIIISIRDMLFWAKPAELKIMQLMMKLSDKIVVNSKAVKQKIKPLCKNTSVQIIYNGILTGKAFERNNRDKDALKKEFNLDNKLIVTLVSNYNRQIKRVDLLIEAVPHIIKEVPAYFIIVGDGWMRESLEKRVKELNIEKYIKFTGLRNDVENILKGSDIALNTSDSEGFSNSVIEAMRAGLPVAATNVSGNKELIKNKETGLLFEPGNIKDLTEKVLYLLKNKDFAGKLGENGKQLIEKQFDVKIMVQQYIKLYRETICVE